MDVTFDPIEYINTPRWQTMSLGLSRIEELLARLGNPQNDLRFVHVAGTNGKGSTSAFLERILREAGYSTGLFTSPYLITFEERIRVNGENISLDDLRAVTLRVRDAAEEMSEHPTEFELMTAVAFLYFKQRGCDIVVAEVGLGGRLDSTNVISTAEACVITPIAFDHCALLGDSLAKIASEKAGIIKEGVPVISAPQEAEVLEVLERVAAEKHSSLEVVSLNSLQGDNDNFSCGDYENLSISLAGRYQRINALVALAAAEALVRRGWHVSPSHIRAGLAQATWPGRFELVRSNPNFIIDGSHNIQGVQALIETLNYRYPNIKPVLLLGILADKDYLEILELLVPFAKSIVCITPPSPRALFAADLRDAINEVASDAYSSVAAPSIAEGVKKAYEQAGEDGLIVACGSLYSIADVMAALPAPV